MAGWRCMAGAHWHRPAADTTSDQPQPASPTPTPHHQQQQHCHDDVQAPARRSIGLHHRRADHEGHGLLWDDGIQARHGVSGAWAQGADQMRIQGLRQRLPAVLQEVRQAPRGHRTPVSQFGPVLEPLRLMHRNGGRQGHGHGQAHRQRHQRADRLGFSQGPRQQLAHDSRRCDGWPQPRYIFAAHQRQVQRNALPRLHRADSRRLRECEEPGLSIIQIHRS
jgi:hypothetical protein